MRPDLLCDPRHHSVAGISSPRLPESDSAVCLLEQQQRSTATQSSPKQTDQQSWCAAAADAQSHHLIDNQIALPEQTPGGTGLRMTADIHNEISNLQAMAEQGLHTIAAGMTGTMTETAADLTETGTTCSMTDIGPDLTLATDTGKLEASQTLTMHKSQAGHAIRMQRMPTVRTKDTEAMMQMMKSHQHEHHQCNNLAITGQLQHRQRCHHNRTCRHGSTWQHVFDDASTARLSFASSKVLFKKQNSPCCYSHTEGVTPKLMVWHQVKSSCIRSWPDNIMHKSNGFMYQSDPATENW